MTRTLRTPIAGAALLGPAFVHTAVAKTQYPWVTGSGDKVEID